MKPLYILILLKFFENYIPNFVGEFIFLPTKIGKDIFYHSEIFLICLYHNNNLYDINMLIYLPFLDEGR